MEVQEFMFVDLVKMYYIHCECWNVKCCFVCSLFIYMCFFLSFMNMNFCHCHSPGNEEACSAKPRSNNYVTM